MEISTIETIIGCVSAGMGITFLPRSVLTGNLHNEKFAIHPLTPEVARVTTRFLRRKDSVEPKALAEFRTVVKDLTQQVDAA